MDEGGLCLLLSVSLRRSTQLLILSSLLIFCDFKLKLYLSQCLNLISKMSQNPNSVEYLKIALMCANNLENPLGRSLTMKDVDHITSDVMVHIVSSLLANLDPSSYEEIQKPSRLYNFEQFGICTNMTYDSRAERTYQCARKYFPIDDDTLDMSIFLFPEHDIRRAKQAIVYLVGFVLLCDTLHDTFQAEWRNLNEENQEKSRLYNEIEDLRNNIAEEVQNLQANKDSKPQLEQELMEKEAKLLVRQSELAKLEDVYKAVKKVYDEKSAINRRLEADKDSLNREKLHMEAQLVHSASELIHTWKTESQKLEEENRQRISLGAELKDVGLKMQSLAKLVERSGSSLAKFEELMKTMQIAGEKLTILNRRKDSYESKMKEIEDLKRSIQQFDSDQNRLQHEITKRMQFYEDECSKWKSIINQSNLVLEDRQFQYDEIVSRLEDINNRIEATSSKIFAMHDNIEMYSQLFEQRVKSHRRELTNVQLTIMKQIQETLANADAASRSSTIKGYCSKKPRKH